MTASTASCYSPVYLDVPRAIEQLGDAQALRNMLPMLLEMLERDVPRIADSLSGGDVRGANALLHSMKGCMPIFCVETLCEELAQLEYVSKTAGIADVLPAYSVLAPKLEQLKLDVSVFLMSAA